MLLRDLARIRHDGFYAYHRADLKFHFLSVPILIDAVPLGCVTVRVIASAMRIATAEERFVPMLRSTVREIASCIVADREAIGLTTEPCDAPPGSRRKP